MWFYVKWLIFIVSRVAFSLFIVTILLVLTKVQVSSTTVALHSQFACDAIHTYKTINILYIITGSFFNKTKYIENNQIVFFSVEIGMDGILVEILPTTYTVSMILVSILPFRVYSHHFCGAENVHSYS